MILTAAEPQTLAPLQSCERRSSPSTGSTMIELSGSVQVNSPRTYDQIIQVVSELFGISKDDFSVRPLLGGLSNSLFVAGSPQLQPVLVRVHPAASTTADDLVDRAVETKLQYWLARQHSLAPTVYGTFENGRVEQLYPDHQALASCREMIVHGPAIARAMAKLHSLALPSDIVFEKSWQERGNQWLTMGKALLQSASADTESAQKLWNTLQAEWEWTTRNLTASIETKNSSSSVSPERSFAAETVLVHGDGQSLNVLVASAGDPQLRLIDYEYACLAPRGLDLANTFCEYCDMNNLNANYAEEYPTDEQQAEFLKAYLKTVAGPEQNLDLGVLGKQVGRYTIVSHLLWAIWSIVRHFQSLPEQNNGPEENSQDESFDYLAYAQQRLDGYHHHKKEFWS